MQQNEKLIVTVRTGQGNLFRVSVRFEGSAHETFLGSAFKENGRWTCTDELAELMALPHSPIEASDLAQYLTAQAGKAGVREKILRKMEW